MSWDIDLVDENDKTVSVQNHREGGVVAIGGTDVASLNITYNYSYFYYNEIDDEEGIRWLDGKRAGDTVDVLHEAVENLGTEPHPDCQSYWCPSVGRAGAALDTLLQWARDNPDATWRVI